MVWETQQITPKEYFQLAIHQFPGRGCPVNEWEIGDTETFYKHGLVAANYINRSKKKMLISFQLIGVDKASQEAINYARDFAKHSKSKAKRLGFEIAYTGYSKGGSIAELCAIQDKVQAYTFDSQAIFDDSPDQNNYFNLVRYTSNPTPEVMYGNVFYVDIYSTLEAELLERWNNALKVVENHQTLN